MITIMNNKDLIIKIFNENIKGININISNKNKKHSGKEGHWLEKQFGIKHNSKNEPDIYNYEMKKHSNKKITIGDFSASEYLFSIKMKRNYINENNKWSDDINIKRDDFIKYFGNFNKNKKRYSWSGTCIPKYKNWNSNGQILEINEYNDLYITYSYSKDQREDYKLTFPDYLQKDNLIIAYWNNDKLKNHIDNKYNKNGFFICIKENDKYEKISFGKPFNFEYFIEGIKNGKVIFDSGMYIGNTRNYSHFRGYSFWNDLIIDTY